MSASLVGSEMCIRDRASMLRLALRPRVAPPQNAAIAIALRRPRGLEAVSYTHLTLPTICSV
eukprot:13171510-Alexandrium_andersonii.AAC.1